jgi:hypothetical protein
MRDKPAPVDLDQLWTKLGVSVKDGTAQFDDKAPEANIRKAITAPPSATASTKSLESKTSPRMNTD